MRHFFWTKFLALLLIIIVAIIDYMVPLGVSVGILYVISLLVLIYEKTATIVSFAIIITLFILINLLFFASTETPEFIIINRFLSVFSIWIVVYMMVRHKLLKARKEAIKDKQKLVLEEMLFITNHKVRHPIAMLQGISQILDNSQFTEQEKDQVTQLLREPIIELTKFTEELTDFMILQKNT